MTMTNAASIVPGSRVWFDENTRKWWWLTNAVRTPQGPYSDEYTAANACHIDYIINRDLRDNN